MSSVRDKSLMLKDILEAKSVAIVGASADSRKLGSRPLALMQKHGFNGSMFPVNPSVDMIGGVKAYPSLAAIGQPIDLVLIMTPAESSPAIVEEGVACGIRNFIVYAAGFAEQDEAGLLLQNRLTSLSQKEGANIIGPNCVGVMNAATRLCATIASVGEVMTFEQGPVSFVSQSGALAGYWLDKILHAKLGFSKWITSGNEADIGMADCVAYLADDPSTKIIGLYLEALRDTQALRAALQRARLQGKPVLALRAGRSEAGARAVVSHTAALAADTRLCDAFLEQYGVQQVSSLSEMVDATKMLVRCKNTEARSPAVISVSGGAGALVTDALTDTGLSLTPFSQHVQDALIRALPSFGKADNPLDLTGAVGADPSLLAKALTPIARHAEHDLLLVFIGLMHGTATGLVEAMVNMRRTSDCPIAVIWVCAPPQAVSTLQEHQIPVFDDIPNAAQALLVSNRAARAIDHSEAYDTKSSRVNPPRLPGLALSEFNAHTALGPIAGLGIPSEVLLGMRAENVVNELSALRAPWVAKLQSAQLLHKTEHGAVQLNLQTEAAVVEALALLRTVAERLDIECDGILLQESVAHDLQMIVGLREDPSLGRLLLIGKGGTDVEDEDDIAILFLPVEPAHIERAILGLRMASRLRGSRGRAPIDIPALAETIFRLCRTYEDRTDIFELEINPLAITAPDRFVALDMLMRRSR